MMFSRRSRALLLCLALGGCSSKGAEIAREARASLIGMKVEDMQACVGIPERTAKLADGSELLSYKQTNSNVGGLDVTLPLLGGFKVAGSGASCQAIFRVAQGRVIGLNYTGDSDDFVGTDGVCAPIVRGCLRYPEPAPVPTPPAPRVVAQPGVLEPEVLRALNHAPPPVPGN
ncbi:hypothetical protein JYK14_10260 [Siccirubricoccus sp. KC 17139]|uniref:DUF3558 domain-containing protein n=1 Tax=Siccirubricoccus soli TaxID=2899147 RepID=A0ABT1D3P0_9PROT|nr:hypothetical protein [Siccirubricoccus soli]MCO6416544.1 hypothetical protein [Siccirubricoccus soli]MCP2682679.1 hypothetical protein [Siccirubricoccus soli]